MYSRKGAHISSRPLKFQNPFFTSGFRKVFNFSYRSPIYNGDISQGEAAMQQQMLEKLQKMKNEGLLKKGDKDGDTNLDGKIDMEALSKMGINSIVMPEGVANVREAEKARDVARQIERFNADILTKKQEEMKKLLKNKKKQQKEELRKKYIKYLAESTDLEGVPPEYREAVEDYYRGEDLIDEEIPDDATPEQRAQIELRNQQNRTERERRTGRRRIVETKRERNKRRKAEEEVNKYRPFGGVPVSDYGRSYGYGMIIPRISHLVKPFHSLDDNLRETPAQIEEKRKQDLEDRQKLFKEYQIFQRGIEPPKEMVKRAMPETATPMQVDDSNSVDDEANKSQSSAKKLIIIPHPFIFKTNKFPVVKFRK